MSKTSEDRIFGSYLFKNYANKGKIEKIKVILQFIPPKLYINYRQYYP
jgi:hypothetical protein